MRFFRSDLKKRRIKKSHREGNEVSRSRLDKDTILSNQRSLQVSGKGNDQSVCFPGGIEVTDNLSKKHTVHQMCVLLLAKDTNNMSYRR